MVVVPDQLPVVLGQFVDMDIDVLYWDPVLFPVRTSDGVLVQYVNLSPPNNVCLGAASGTPLIANLILAGVPAPAMLRRLYLLLFLELRQC